MPTTKIALEDLTDEYLTALHAASKDDPEYLDNHCAWALGLGGLDRTSRRADRARAAIVAIVNERAEASK